MTALPVAPMALPLAFAGLRLRLEQIANDALYADGIGLDRTCCLHYGLLFEPGLTPPCGSSIEGVAEAWPAEARVFLKSAVGVPPGGASRSTRKSHQAQRERRAALQSRRAQTPERASGPSTSSSAAVLLHHLHDDRELRMRESHRVLSDSLYCRRRTTVGQRRENRRQRPVSPVLTSERLGALLSPLLHRPLACLALSSLPNRAGNSFAQLLITSLNRGVVGRLVAARSCWASVDDGPLGEGRLRHRGADPEDTQDDNVAHDILPLRARRWCRAVSTPHAKWESRLFAGPGSYPMPGLGLFYSAGDPTERDARGADERSVYSRSGGVKP